ncbi:recombinase family protein [Anaeroselena agilis]|uniref:Recombinase family protein n=1 Tax=Anaeroselena agilis TaxID=3063788 RepID=A0ABU3NYK4_9FIRM|nr:recombinase family protein [Selenomonadales bacterium 4137-cl]
MQQRKDLEPACLYLRKSREDREAEARGEKETLEKHRKTLYKLAKDYNVNITGVFPEVESGEFIIHRPEMVKLLREISEGKWRSVWVMEIDRLGRGDMEDQGYIQKTFKQSGTLIVTPRKIYDLNDEMDEEYTEFEQFMARKEFKIINRRLQRGRKEAASEGFYLGARPPYGYNVEKTTKGRILVPHPEQAPVVKLIFDLYVSGMGGHKIAAELNRLGHSTYSGKPWESSSVLFVIKNEVYSGRIQWRKKEEKKSLDPGKKQTVRTRPRQEWIDVQGRHEPLVAPETFAKAQEILRGRYHVPYQLNGLVNPLAGFIRCDMCGGAMVLRTYRKQQPHLICYNTKCRNKSTRFEYVEERMVEGLAAWLHKYRMEWDAHKQPEATDTIATVKEQTLKSLNKELQEMEKQKSSLHDFLERGIYDEQTFLDRAHVVSQRISDTQTAIAETEKVLIMEQKRRRVRREIIPKVEQALKLYRKSTDPAAKNDLLRSVLDYAIYRKERWQEKDDFTLVLYPKLTE